MKRFLLLLALVPAGLWAIFALPDVLAGNPAGFWAWRRPMILLSGILALWWMSAGMVLAMRPTWLESRLGGLDKLYRWHKNIGMGAGLIVFTHWMIEWLPKNLAKAGWIAGPNRPRGPRGEPDMWIDLAKDVGEWAGYILLGLVVIALVKRIPYRYFRWVHKLFGLVFVAGAFHGLMLMPRNYWDLPLAWVTLGVAALGIVPAMRSLSGRIGQQRRRSGKIEAVHTQADGVLEVVVRPSNWPGHKAGQFLFAHFGVPGEGGHPFTIASAWQAEAGTLTLAIKALGDFTATLPDRLSVGENVVLEGPYGGFDFAADASLDTPQIWVAGGIGVTPFVARLQALIAQGNAGAREVDFFYATRGEQTYPENLPELCQRAGVRLHRRATDSEGSFRLEEVGSRIRPECKVWFCGPAGWGASLKDFLTRAGLPSRAFHREYFEFR